MLSDDVQINMAKWAIRRKLPIFYKKRTSEIEIYCPNCQEYNKYSLDKFKEVKYSKCCPKCRCSFDEVKEYKKPVTIFGFTFYENFEGSNGYETDVTFRFKREFSILSRHVYKNRNGKDYIKGLWLGYGYSAAKPCWIYGEVWPQNKKWKQINSARWTCDFENYKEYVPTTKKEALDSFKKYNFKSNQVKLILDHPFSVEQIIGIKVFDLKEASDVYRNRKYLEKQFKYNLTCDETFNLSTLEYLRKNDINLNLYIDYANMCKKINRKLDKPKDFKLWHDRVIVMVHVAETKDLPKKIKERYQELQKNNYHTKNIEIKAFSSKKEIQKVSRCLHNCMERLYMKDYANGETDLYHLDVDNKPMLAIEVNDGELRQVYGDHNQNPPKNLERIVTRWQRRIA